MHFALIHNHFLFPHKSDFPVYLGFSSPKWLSINIRLIFISLCTLMKVAIFNTLALNVQEEWIYIYIYQYYRDLAMCVLQVISARLANIYYVFEFDIYNETGNSYWHFLHVLFLSCYIHLFSWQFLPWSSQEVWLTGLKHTTVMMIRASSPRVSQAQRFPSMVCYEFLSQIPGNISFKNPTVTFIIS